MWLIGMASAPLYFRPMLKHAAFIVLFGNASGRYSEHYIDGMGQ